MKKVAFIVPKGSKYGKNKFLKDFLAQNDVVSKFYGAWETPNLSLLTIAGVFPDNYQLQFIDEDHGQVVPFDEHFDLVLITGMTQQINRAYEICDEYRKRGVYTVLGGIHATLYEDEALQHANTVLVGEGEEIVLQFLADYEEQKEKRIYRSERFIDLTKSPTPRYDLVDSSLYNSYSIQTTRGCPHTCRYCTLPVMYGAKYRHKTVAQVIKEIHAIKQVDHTPFVFFADDNMFINKEFSMELIKEIKKENIIWGTQTDIAIAEKPEILNQLKESGCRWLFIGFENISKKSLALLDRNQWKANMSERYEKLIEKIHDAGLYIWGSFMFGTDQDDQSVFQDTLEFTIKNGIYSGSFTILTPLPGTELFKDMSNNHRIIDYDWSRYTFWDVVYEPKNMTQEELAKGVAWIYDQFYSPENTKRRMAVLKRNIKKNRGVR